MKHLSIRIVLLLTLGWFITSQAQVPDKDRATIEKLLGYKLKKIPSESDYFTYFECTTCTVDSSELFYGKTNGATYDNEWVLYHDPVSFSTNTEILKLLRTSFVSVEEYLAFEKWVRDSIAMEHYYFGRDIPDYNAKFIVRDKKKVYYDKGKEIPSYQVYREEMRSDITFDHSVEFDYDHPRYVPYLADMYLPYPQRYYGQREFDKRKLVYRYTASYERLAGLPYDSIAHYFPQHLSSSTGFGKIQLEIPILRNEYALATWSEQYRDVPAVYSILGDLKFRKLAAYGLKGFQASAFCDWKTKMLQHELDQKGLEYRIVITLPSEQDAQIYPVDENTIAMEERAVMEQWRITNAEYREFVSFVQDSLIRDYLFYHLPSDKAANQLIQYEDFFFDEGSLEYVEFDPSDREWSRLFFPHDLKHKIKRTKEVDSLLGFMEKTLVYRYMEMNAADRAFEGNYLHNARYLRENPDIRYKLTGVLIWNDTMKKSRIGKDLQLGDVNLLGESNAIRTHNDLKRFIDQKVITLSVTDPSEVPDNDAHRTSLSYEEAMAYYNWRYPIQKAKETDAWQDFLYPSPGQYQAIIEGKDWVFPAQQLDYPGPLFRYVIHVYPK